MRARKTLLIATLGLTACSTSGEHRANDAGVQPIVLSSDAHELRDAFNRSSDAAQLVVLVSPT